MYVRPHHATFPSRWITLAFVALLVCTAIPQSVAAQAATPPSGLDLAALVLGPDDLDAVGMPGFGADLGLSYFTTEEMLDEKVILFGRLWSAPAMVPGVETTVTRDTWRRYHEQRVAKPVPNNPGPLEVDVQVTSGIEEYASPDAAAAGFALFTTKDALGNFDPRVTTLLPVTTPFGDEAVMARLSTSVEGFNIAGVVSVVRVGSYILNVTVADLGHDYDPSAAIVEQLMSRLVSRVESAQVADSVASGCLPTGPGQFGATMTSALGSDASDSMPGLDRCVQRFVGNDVEANLAGYTVRNGDVVPLFPAPTAAEHAEEQAYVTEIGLVHSYQSRYRIYGPNGEAFIYVDLNTYTDAAIAASRFESTAERLNAETTFEVHAFEHDHIDLGDDSYRFVQQYLKNGNMWTASAVRIGHISVIVYASGLPDAIPAVVDQLLVSQVACMEANDCTTPIPAPPALFDGMLQRTT